MKRVWQVLAGIGLLVAVLVAGLVIFIGTLDPEDYREVITGPVKEATGRDLTFTNIGKFQIGIPIAIAVDGAQLSNAPWGSRPEMVTVQRMEVEVAVLPLLLGRPQVNRIVVRGVDLLLETDAKGRGNWVFEPAPKPEAAPGAEAGRAGPKRVPFIKALALRDVVITYRNGRTGLSDQVALDSLDLGAQNVDGPLSLDLKARFNEAPVTLSGTIGSLRGLFRGSEPYPVSLEAKGLGATLAAKGAIARPLEGRGLDLSVSLESEGLAKEAARAGLSLPELPAFGLSGQLTDPEGAFALEGLKVRLGENRLTGQAKLSLAGTRPRVEAALGAQVFDLSGLTPATPEKEAAKPPKQADRRKRLIPDIALPLGVLGALDGKLTLKVDRLVVTPELTAEQVALSADLEGGRLGLQPNIGRLAQGRLSGRLQADQRGPVSVRLDASGLTLGELLTAFGVTTAIKGGPLDADVDLRGNGGGLREFLAGADGNVKVEIGESRIQGQLIDLSDVGLLAQVLGAVDPRAAQDQSTGVKCGVFRASVISGKAHFRKGIGVESDNIDLLGAGTVDLGTEAVDLGIRSEAHLGQGRAVSAAASNLVRVGGTLAEPRVGVDPVGAAETAARIGGAVLTGGLSLLGEAAFATVMGSTPPCQIALGEADKAKPEKKDGGEGVEGIIEDIGEGLKGLFGD